MRILTGLSTQPHCTLGALPHFLLELIEALLGRDAIAVNVFNGLNKLERVKQAVVGRLATICII